MAKGFIRGVLAGTAVSVVGVSALSILSGLQPADMSDAAAPADQVASAPPVATEPVTAPVEPPAAVPAPVTAPADTTAAAPGTAPDTPPETGQVTVPAGSGFTAGRDDRQALLPAPDAAPSPAPVQTLEPAAPLANPPLPRADRDPAAQPQTDQAATAMPAPSLATDTPVIAALPATSGDGATPRSTVAPTEPQQPAGRDTAVMPVAPEVATQPAQPDQTQAAADPGPTQMTVPREDAVVDISPRAEAGSPPARTAVLAPQDSPRRQPLPVIEPAPPAVQPDQTAPTAPVAVQDINPVLRPRIGTPATSLVDRPAPGEAGAGNDIALRGPADGSASPLRANALPFDDNDTRPRLSIVLIDRGDSGLGPDALAGFPYPLTIAIDTTRPDAPEASDRYRRAGFEVLALVDLMPGSTAQDAEIAMEASLAAVPEAVGVLEGDATGLQSSRELSDQVSAILGQRGYGLVMLPNGLNTAQKMAAKSGVPSATVFRDFDGAGQDAAAIRRFLDQGAFKAGQQAEGLPAAGDGAGVIMIGRLRPETISALLLWGLQDRAQRVALAPVSAVLQAAE
ncbi:MAG: divergent polysaccharide deacetylase family protein [Paracoccaceae bacterium]|nr:divergent polysaccharide deacetylase family protein [Paracoccaceae bacterium]